MNNKRRSDIKRIMYLLDNVISQTDKIRDEEQDYLDNMPENLQSSLRADNSQDAIDLLDEALSLMEEAKDKLSDIM